MTVRLAIAVALPVVATMAAIWELLTTVVVTENDWVVAPALTVMIEGTGTAAELLIRLTGNPPAGAFAFNVTVPVDIWPPVTLDGLKASAATTGGSSVMVAIDCDPLNDAVTVAEICWATAIELMLKLALSAPAATVTVGGTATSALLLVSVTGAPPAAAAELSTTVPREP